MAESKKEQPPDVEELLSELVIKIERCKQLYEQYFMGIEKMEPLIVRKEITRALLLLQQQYIRNTGLRFKFNTMLQKWNIYVTYWNRILREIESGTYVRHLERARRAAARDGKSLPDELEPKRRPPSGTFDTREGGMPEKHFLDLDSSPHVVALQPLGAVLAKQLHPEEKTDPGLERVPATGKSPPPLPPFAPATPARRASVELPPPPLRRPVPSVPGMSEQDLRALHRKYCEARQQSGERATVSYETLVNSLAKQVPRVLEQPGVRTVRFDVALQNGKVILKAIPQK